MNLSSCWALPLGMGVILMRMSHSLAPDTGLSALD